MAKRMLTDEEVDAMLDAEMERAASKVQVDKSIIVINVRGRISSVSWLEQKGAKKQPYFDRRGKKWTEYEIELPENEARDLMNILSAESGIWFEQDWKVSF